MNHSESSAEPSLFNQPAPVAALAESANQSVRIARWTTLAATTGAALQTLIAGLRAWLYLRTPAADLSPMVREFELQQFLQLTLLAAGTTFVGALFVVYLEWRYPRGHR